MRLLFLTLFQENPFKEILDHAEMIKTCAWSFQHAIECRVSATCGKFEDIRAQIDQVEKEAISVQQKIRNKLPKGPVSGIGRQHLLEYIRVQEAILESIQKSLNWFAYREDRIVPKTLEKDLFMMVDSIMDPIEELTRLVSDVDKYFNEFSVKRKKRIKAAIENIRRMEREAEKAEERLKRKAFQILNDPVSVFRMFRLAENIGKIADHTALAADKMLSMVPI